MLRYIYDGTFEGLLTCIYEAYYRHETPTHILCGDELQEDLLDRYVTINTDKDKSNKVLNSIRIKISNEALDTIFRAYLSEIEDIGVWVYRYLKLGWKVGASVESYLWEDAVVRVHEACNKVQHEAHRMLGLIRFRELQGDIYYAPIGPDHNVISLVAPHFTKRLGDQSWMIHDVKRDIAALYNKKDWTIAVIHQKNALPLHGDELEFQRLWKQYYQSIAITGRRNPKLQRRNMPSRYWLHLVEKN